MMAENEAEKLKLLPKDAIDWSIDATGDETDDIEANDTNEISFEEFRHLPANKQYQRLSNQSSQEFVDSMKEAYKAHKKQVGRWVVEIDDISVDASYGESLISYSQTSRSINTSASSLSTTIENSQGSKRKSPRARESEIDVSDLSENIYAIEDNSKAPNAHGGLKRKHLEIMNNIKSKQNSKKANETLKQKAAVTKTAAKKKQAEKEDDYEVTIAESSTENERISSTQAVERNSPNSEGIFYLHAYKGDLKNGFRANTSICLWRREGQRLIQKYLRDKDGKGSKIYFNSSMMYSCLLDERKNEFIEVKVKCVPDASKKVALDSKVEILDINTLEQKCIDEKYRELDLQPYVSYHDKTKKDSLNRASTSQFEEDEYEEVDDDEETSEDEE